MVKKREGQETLKLHLLVGIKIVEINITIIKELHTRVGR